MRRPGLHMLLSLAMLSTTIQAAVPQETVQQEISKVERKNRAPVSKDILRVKLPPASEHTLSNGLNVLIMENHRLPLISLQYNISAAGPLFEPPELSGLAGATAQMLREGTKTRTSLQIAEEVANLGASLNATSGFGSSATVVSASGLSDNFDQWFALANDILLNPTFPAEELNRLKQRQRTALRQQRTSPGFLSNETFNKAVYGAHPASRISPTTQAIDAFTPELLANWHREKYAPQNALLVIAGDVKASDLVPRLEKSLAAWKRTDLKEVLPPNPKPAAEKKVHIVNRPNSVQTSIMLGNIAIDRRDADYPALTVFNHILGGSGAARLFLNLREEKGYTYGVYSSFTAVKFPGPWRAYGDVRTEVTEGAMTEFFREINRIRDERVPANELEDAKRAIVASFALSLESNDDLIGYAIVRKIYGFPNDYWETYPAKIMAITAADVQRVARKYMDPANLQVVAVGDATKIKPIMEKYGPVQLYDMDGKVLGN